MVAPEPQTRLRVALDASGIITSFATEYIQKHEIKAGFRSHARRCSRIFKCTRASATFSRRWASGRRSADWLQSRLKQEIFNQALGVAKGDEVEAQRDPAVRAAIERLVARL